MSANVDYSELDALEEAMKDYEGDVKEKINGYLHGKGYETFEKAVRNAMPESGRSWKGKKSPAKSGKSIQDKYPSSNLSVTIASKKPYGYLYFPDDGSNTLHHFGNQHFFEHGVEQETDRVKEDMVELLSFEE